LAVPSSSAPEPGSGTRGETVFTVTQANAYLKEALDSDPVLADMTVSGEVSGYRKPASGHHYFALRDPAATLKCVMFAPGRGGGALADGAQVIARGRISVYPARGELQLYVSSVRPAGLGALQAAFEELKRRLEAEGLFDAGRKRPLPAFPQKIGVITSPSGAVLQDILNVLRRRYPLCEVVLVPTPVQGETAAAGIVSAFAAANEAPDLDVVILARGGGSLENLWPFNEEAVARAIFACRVPVISAIGHETDFTIADFVADVRAPTPSAAAELVVPDSADLARQVRAGIQSMYGALASRLREARMTLELARDRLTGGAPELELPRREIEGLLVRARGAAMRVVDGRRGPLADVAGRLTRVMPFGGPAVELHLLKVKLEALGPAQILQRGYAIVKLKGGPVVVESGQVTAGDSLEIRLARGSVEARAESTSGK
jgi:exodeoxyribonuclease VII large subunit